MAAGLTKTRAIVLNSRKYGESDLVVSFVTPEMGLVSGFAKGAVRSMKRFSGSLEPFTLVELGLRPGSGSLARLDSADIIASNSGIRDDLDRIQAASCVAETAALVEPTANERAEAFGIVERALSAIAGSDRPLELMAVYTLRYLDVCGFGVDTGTCSACGGPITGAASYAGGDGLLCGRCAGHGAVALGRGLTAFMKAAGSLDERATGRLRLPAAALREFSAFMGSYLRALSGREPRTFTATGARGLS